MGISIGLEEKVSRHISIVVGQEADRNHTFHRSLPATIPKDHDNVSTSAILRRLKHGTPDIGDTPRKDNALQNSQKSEVFSNTNPQGLKRCELWCDCKCHVRWTFKCPWVLETVTGRINVQYTGQQPECSKAQCKRTSTAPLRITYHLPKYLLNRNVTMTIHYSPLEGPTFALHVPRVTAWAHMYWNYANSGDLPAIQNMFAQGRASPYDLNLIGCNALMYKGVLQNLKVARFLVEQGADPYIQCVTGRAPINLLTDFAFSGKFGSEGISIIGSIVKDIDYLRLAAFLFCTRLC